jgi:hypothetical protein
MKTSSKQNKSKTEADAKSMAASTDSKGSSHDNKSHTKAGGQTGAGGGKKQQRHG